MAYFNLLKSSKLGKSSFIPQRMHLQIFVDRLTKHFKTFLHNHPVHSHAVFKIIITCIQLGRKEKQNKKTLS